MAVTRIKNNQITDAAIVASTKVAAGSIVGSLFASNLTMTSDVLITGNLQVQGSTSYSTLASTNTYVNDPLIVLNNGATGSNSKDIGLVFELGDDTNQAVIWDETESAFAFASTSETGATEGNMNITAYADLQVKDLTLAGATASGDIAINGGDLTTTATTFNLLDATATTINFGGEATTLELGAATGTTTVHNAVDIDLDLNVDGGDITTGATTFNLVNTTATTVNFAGAGTDVQIGASTGTTNVNNGLLVDLSATVTGDIAVNGGDLTTTATTFNLVNATATTVNLAGGASAINIGAAAGNVTVADGLVVTDTIWGTDVYGDNLTLTSLTATRVTLAGTNGLLDDNANFTFASDVLSVANMNIDGTAGAVTISATGTNEDIVIAPSGTGAIDASGAVIFNLADPTADDEAVTLGYMNNALSSEVTNIIADDTVVEINDNGVNPGNIGFVVDDAIVANLYPTTGQFFSNTLYLDDGANVAVSGGATFYVGLTSEFDGAVVIDATTTSTTTTTGALKVAGGAGIVENLNVGGVTKVTNTTTSTTSTTGALIVGGGAGIAENLNVGGHVVVTGNLTVNGTTTTVNSTTLDVTDLNITIADGAADSAAANGAGLTVDGASATILYTHATTSWDFNKPVKTTDTTESTTPTTGALLSGGGLGVAGDVFIGGGDLGTDQTTFNLLDAAATTINFGGAATTLELGAATGTTTVHNALDVDLDVNIDGGDLTTGATTFNLVNATATTVNFAGAGTDVQIGASTGTTNVNNALDVDLDVNIDGGDLTTGAATFNLVNTTATTVNFAGAGTTIEIGAATGTLSLNNAVVDADGNVNVDGGAITTNGTDFDLLNTTATTVNFAGAGTTIEIGAATGTTNVNNALDVDLDVNIDGGDLTTNATTFNLLNATATTVNFAGAGTDVQIGASTGTTNVNNGLLVDLSATVTGDIAVNGGDLTTTATTFNLLDATATTINFGGAATDLQIGAATGNVTVGNSAVITADLYVTDIYGTDAILTSLDAGTVDAGNMTLTGNDITSSDGEVVINDAQGDVNFRVESDTNANMLFVDAAAEAVVIGSGTVTTGATFKVVATDSMMLPNGTTGQRPTGAAGMIRYNSTTDQVEAWDVSESQFKALGVPAFTVIASETETGNGSTVEFTLDEEQTTASCIVSINGIVQLPTDAYAVSGTTLTFTEAPATGDVIEIRKLTTTNTITAIVDGDSTVDVTNGHANLVTAGGSVKVNPAGNVTVTGSMTINGELNVLGDTNGQINIGSNAGDSVVINADVNSDIVPNTDKAFDLGSATQGWGNVYVNRHIHDDSGVTVGSGSAVTIDSFAVADVRSAKYLITAENAAGDEWEVTEVTVIHDDTTATRAQYGTINTGTVAYTYTATVSAGVVLVQCQADEANTTLKVMATYIKA